LDTATTQLKLRSTWGLPPRRLTEPARPLQGAIADLEALTGHAVVLKDDALIDYFRTPEPCAAAVCVPVSTPSTVLGTLWIFSQEKRDFSDKQVNLLEIIAGRVAGELERDALLGEALPAHDRMQQSRAVERLVSSRLTQFAPHIPGWDLAAQTDQPGGCAGSFCDWLQFPDAALAIAIADANGVDGEAGFVAQAIRSAIRAHAMYQTCPAQLLNRVNQTLWCASGTDPFAAAMVGTVDPASGMVRCATAGNVLVLLLSSGKCTSFFKPELPLGVQPNAAYELREIALAPGDVLIVATHTAGEPFEAPAQALTDARTQRSLLRCRHEPAGKLAAAVRHLLRSHASDPPHEHGAVLVISRHAAPCV
jgi:serine phosphatase RsbU (regulator of sigma subunit)